MRFKCINPDCQAEHTVQSYNIKATNSGGIRMVDDSGDPVDICRECNSKCEEIRVFKGFATMRGGKDSGNGGKSNAR